MRKASILVATFLCASTVSCAKRPQRDNCAQELSEQIQAGTSRIRAEQALDQCGFSHSFDERTNTIYGLRPGEKNGLIRQDWSAQIQLGARQKVRSVKVERVYTGP